MTIPPAEDYLFSEQIGHLLRKAYQRHVTIFQKNIADEKLTVAQFVVMCAVRKHQPCTLSDIANVSVIDPATVRGIIQRLQLRKLIQTSHDPNDQRKVIVMLTPTGTELVTETIPFAHTISQHTFGNLNEAERVAIIYLLQKMNA
jgi:DNA-binding MarR family transcriptional regulator